MSQSTEIRERRRLGGFSLIELMVAMTICAILASIALPAYRQHIIRSHRSAAKAEMMDLAARQQQFLIANRSYVDTAGLAASGYVLPAELAERYDLAVALGDGAAPTYTITMTPKGGQASDGPLTLDSRGNRTPEDKWQR